MVTRIIERDESKQGIEKVADIIVVVDEDPLREPQLTPEQEQLQKEFEEEVAREGV